MTKSDLPSAAEIRDRLALALEQEVLLMSSVTGQGLNTLVGTIAQVLEDRRQESMNHHDGT